MIKIKLYIAGKVSPDSVFGTHAWRDAFCTELQQKSGYEIVNLDPKKSSKDFDLNEKDYKLIVGRDCFMINMADLVVVNLTDDISVGGSQEMLIAKYFKKPLIGIAPKEGKFNKEETEILGRKYRDYIHPFVAIPCDRVLQNIDELADVIRKEYKELIRNPKTISVLDDALNYYQSHFHDKDLILHAK